MKLGVYISTRNGPHFLRLQLYQLLHQTRRPDVVSIHENGHAPQYTVNTCYDVVNLLVDAGIKLVAHYTEPKLESPFFAYIALRGLLDSGCDYYTKFDHDDIFFEHHLNRLEQGMIGNPDTNWVANKNASIAIIRRENSYVWKERQDFGVWNPTGAMSDGVMFNRTFAEQYLEELKNSPLQKDDVVMAEMMQKLPGRMWDITPSAVYVSHGFNDSSFDWCVRPPKEVLP